VCRKTQFARFDKALPGRAAQVAIVGGRVFVATIEPEQRHLLAGELTEGGQAIHVLDVVGAEISNKHLAIAGSAGVVTVVWLGDDGAYRFARHQTDAPSGSWSLDSVELHSPGYTGTEHFDLAVSASGEAHLVFQDVDLVLKRLTSDDWSQWSLGVIDDGQQERLGGCAEDRQVGVGAYPDVYVGQEVWATYRDGDCGDVLLAREEGSGWRVSPLDDGLSERESESPIGMSDERFPSIALDQTGTLAVAFQDRSRGQVVYATAGQGTFETEVADPGLEIDSFSQQRKDWVGAFLTLVFDDQNRPHIVYMNATTGELRHATKDSAGQGWTQRTRAQGGVTGFSADQAFDPVIGHILTAERVVPRNDRVRSELVLIWDRSP
jgi:hypothetical protein